MDKDQKLIGSLLNMEKMIKDALFCSKKCETLQGEIEPTKIECLGIFQFLTIRTLLSKHAETANNTPN